MNAKNCWLVVLAAALIGLGGRPVCAAETPKVGDRAPDVVGQDQDGKAWKLTDLAGKQAVILYFYPKDNTPGCTKEACGLRDRMGELQQAGVAVVGVSFDSAESHKKFIADHQLNFTLLADTNGKIADQFGARIPDRKMARRVSFLIGKDGVIKHVTDSPKAETHLEELKAALEKLK